jgi:hypothetical protein
MTMFGRDTLLRLCSTLVRIDIVASVAMAATLPLYLRGH